MNWYFEIKVNVTFFIKIPSLEGSNWGWKYIQSNFDGEKEI